MKVFYAISCIFILAILVGSVVWAVEYQIIELGTLPGGSVSIAKAINDNGQIVGLSDSTNKSSHAFLWEKGLMQDLGALGHSSWAESINNNGQVVGGSYVSLWDCHGFLWENGTMNDLGTLEGDWSRACDINNSGQVAGYSAVDGGASSWSCHAVMWHSNTVFDVSGGFRSRAYGINEQGQLVGQGGSNGHAFLWHEGSITDLGTLNGNESAARAINNNSQVVGESHISHNFFHAFLWENGSMVDLGTLGTLGSTASRAWDINDKGQIVGESAISVSSWHAFLWENGTIQDLSTLPGGTNSTAYGINEKGWIVGESDNQAVLWVPVTKISIDIRPGDANNNINLHNRGVVPVAILSTSEFNAGAIDPSTVCFCSADPTYWVMEDVDKDGAIDMLLLFRIQSLELTAGSVEGALSGWTTNRDYFRGTDKVRIVGKQVNRQ